MVGTWRRDRWSDEMCHFGFRLGPRSRPFTGHFVTFPSIQLLAQTEARMTHFVTRTVPSPRADHSLRHSTTMVGLRTRRVRILFFREKVRFGRFSWAIAHGFRHPGQFFRKSPLLSQNTCRWHFAKTHLRTLLARIPTTGGVMHWTMVGTWRRDRQSDEMHHFGFCLGK
jgi:hypothetical protein